MRLSATKLKTFSGCARKYYYTYHERLYGAASIPLVLGRAVHEGIAAGLLGKDIVKSYYEAWVKGLTENSLEDSASQYNRGLRMVLDFPYPLDDPPLYVEQEYVISYPETNPTCEFVVILDQIYPWGIKDLKTNKRKPNQLLLDNDIQFILYAHAFRRIMGYPPERMIWHHLETQEEIVADVLNKEHIIDDVVAGLVVSETNNSFPRRIGFECGWCAFSDRCLGVPCHPE